MNKLIRAETPCLAIWVPSDLSTMDHVYWHKNTFPLWHDTHIHQDFLFDQDIRKFISLFCRHHHLDRDDYFFFTNKPADQLGEQGFWMIVFHSDADGVR